MDTSGLADELVACNYEYTIYNFGLESNKGYP